jgi:hypothetical protein
MDGCFQPPTPCPDRTFASAEEGERYVIQAGPEFKSGREELAFAKPDK